MFNVINDLLDHRREDDLDHCLASEVGMCLQLEFRLPVWITDVIYNFRSRVKHVILPFDTTLVVLRQRY